MYVRRRWVWRWTSARSRSRAASRRPAWASCSPPGVVQSLQSMRLSLLMPLVSFLRDCASLLGACRSCWCHRLHLYCSPAGPVSAIFTMHLGMRYPSPDGCSVILRSCNRDDKIHPAMRCAFAHCVQAYNATRARKYETLNP